MDVAAIRSISFISIGRTLLCSQLQTIRPRQHLLFIGHFGGMERRSTHEATDPRDVSGILGRDDAANRQTVFASDFARRLSIELRDAGIAKRYGGGKLAGAIEGFSWKPSVSDNQRISLEQHGNIAVKQVTALYEVIVLSAVVVLCECIVREDRFASWLMRWIHQDIEFVVEVTF